ncbi:MAG TPA: SpoIID/LytB domain-containing protein [Nocardioides sp.]|nr:SpoIID/LytB domain-containing protein [Nocardioides sp.]
MMLRRSRAVAAVLAAAVATVLSPSSAQAATLTHGMTIVGHGWGHGHGMSQYGARGAAVKGLTYKQILGFYYPHTTWSTTSGTVRVLLAEITNNRLTVKPRAELLATWSGHAAVSLAKAQPSADQWQVVPAASGRSTLMYHVAAGWKPYAGMPVAGGISFSAPGKVLSVGIPGGWRSYRGTVGTVPQTNQDLRWIVNTLPLDQYLLGVVPSEMPSSWPAQALQSQAVAARTYAAYEMQTPANGAYQLYDDTRSQVYRGYSAEQSSTNAAVAATNSQILTYGGKPAFTEFASSNGGYELAGQSTPEPYLPSQKDPYEQYGSNPYATWSASIPIGTILANVRSKCGSNWTTITGIGHAYYPPAGDPWFSRIYVYGNGGTCTYYGYEFRVDFGLRSANFGYHVS